MRGQKRTPFTKAVSPNTKLKDVKIQEAAAKLFNLKESDLPIKTKFDKIELLIATSEIPTLNLCKILYCLNYKREMFLHLGVIVESQVNKVIQTYQSNNWRTPLAFIDGANQNTQFNKFLKEKALSEKANDISRFNLFNHSDTSDQIKHKIQSFRFLRNYGGHSKSVNEFLDTVIDNQPYCDDEIDDAFKLISSIHIAHDVLIHNPPSNI